MLLFGKFPLAAEYGIPFWYTPIPILDEGCILPNEVEGKLVNLVRDSTLLGIFLEFIEGTSSETN